MIQTLGKDPHISRSARRTPSEYSPASGCLDDPELIDARLTSGEHFHASTPRERTISSHTDGEHAYSRSRTAGPGDNGAMGAVAHRDETTHEGRGTHCDRYAVSRP